MFDYFNTNYQTNVRFGYEIIRKNHLFNEVADDSIELDDLLRFNVKIFDMDRLLKEVLKDE